MSCIYCGGERCGSSLGGQSMCENSGTNERINKMSIISQFNDGLEKVMEGKSQEEQDEMMKMLAQGFKDNPNCQECSLKALINKNQPQKRCIHCNKMFLVDEIANGCPDCKQNEFE